MLLPGRPFIDCNQMVMCATVVATLAEINAGKVLLPAFTGGQYEIVGIHTLTAGVFAALTDVRIATTEASPTAILTMVAAQLGDGVVHSHLTGTNVLGAAFWAPLALGYGVQIIKTGSTGTGGTSITIKLFYKVVKPS